MGNPVSQGGQASGSLGTALGTCPTARYDPRSAGRHPFRRAPMFPFLEEPDRSEPGYSIWTRSTRQRSEAIFQPYRSPGEVVHTPPPQQPEGALEPASGEAGTDAEEEVRRPVTPFKCPLHQGGGRRHKYKLRLGYDPRVFLEDPALRGQKLSPEAEKWAAAYRSRIPMVSEPQMSRRLGVDAPTWLGPATDTQRAQVASRSLRQHLFAQPSDSEEEYEMDITSEGELAEQAEAEQGQPQVAAGRVESAAERWPHRRRGSLATAVREATIASQEQRRAAARAESLLQARLARQGAQGAGASLGPAQTAALMQEVANPESSRLPELLAELESRALALEQIRATSLAAARSGERTRVRNVEHLSMNAMQRRVSRITSYLQRQTGVSLHRTPNFQDRNANTPPPPGRQE